MDPNDQNQPDTDKTPAIAQDDSAGSSTPSNGSQMPPSEPTDSGSGMEHAEEELPPPPPAPEAPTPASEGPQQDDGEAGSIPA